MRQQHQSGSNPVIHTDHRLYGSIHIYSPDNVLMFLCNEKKLDWYVSRDLAEQIDENKWRLKFKPNGLGQHGFDYYLTSKQNICVVCGSDDGLTKHHCIPREMGRYLSISTSNNSHDVVMVCRTCHDFYERVALNYKNNLDPEGFEKYESRRKKQFSAIKSALVLKNPHPQMTELKRANHIQRIESHFGREHTQQDIDYLCENRHVLCRDSRWKEYVENLEDQYQFCADWRKHFVETMNPKFLPADWSIDGVNKNSISFQNQPTIKT